MLGFTEAPQTVEEIVDVSIARSIGISSAQAQKTYDISYYDRHPLSVLQIKHQHYLVQPGLIALCKEYNIIVTAFSSFGPQSRLELPPVYRERAKDITLLFDVKPVEMAAS